jgi:molybdate transport system substrate-binding protein
MGYSIAEYTEDVLANAGSAYRGELRPEGPRQGSLPGANVRAWAVRVALEEADATFVYESYVTEDIRDRLQVVEIPEELNVLATYPIATVEKAQNPGWGESG